MTKNTLSDLSNHLFAQLERLNDEDTTGETLEEEIERAKAISSIAKSVIDNGKLALEAEKFMDDRMDADRKIPKLLEG